MGIHLGETDCLSNLRVADDVLFFSTSLEPLERMMRDFKRSTEKVGLKIHPDKTTLLSNQGSNERTDVTIDNINVRKVSRTSNNVRAARNNRNKEQDQSCVGIIYQIQTRIDIEFIPLTSQSPLIQYLSLLLR